MNELSPADALALSGRGNDGFGGDGNGWWIILLFMIFGWGGNRGYGYGGGNDVGGDALYPWLNQQQMMSQGFANAATQLCGGLADVQMSLAGGFAGVETNANARQMASMQQMFSLQQQLSDCCCENRLATANQTATILAENCADRAAISDGVRDIIASQTAGTQRILDQLCQDKIDAKNEEIANLRQQINMMSLAASQAQQTQQLVADNFAQTNALEQYLAPVPRPAYVVQNPNCCQQTYGCGCAA